MSSPSKEVRMLLRVISDLQVAVGNAQNNYDNDRSQMSFEQGRNELEKARHICIETLSKYDPKYFDPALKGGEG